MIPLYPKFPFIRIPGTYVSVRLEDFFLLIVTLVFGIYFFKELPKLLKNQLEFSVVAFILTGCLSLISGIFLTQTVNPSLGFLSWLRRVEYFVPLAVGIFYFKRNGVKDLEFFVKVIVMTILVAFVYGFGQKHFSWPVIITQNEEYAKGAALRWLPGSHINSTFAGHYDLATFLVFLLPLVVSYYFLLKGFWSKFFLAITFFAGLWLLANAVSRISVFSYLLATTISLILLKKYKVSLVVVVVSLVFFSFSGALLARYTNILEVTYQKLKPRFKLMQNLPSPVVYAVEESSLTKRVNQVNLIPPESTSVFEDRSMSIRLNVEWPRALRAFTKNPLLGTGYSSITLATDNDFLRLLGEVGIFGFVAFILVLRNLLVLIKRSVSRLSKLSLIESAFVAGYIGGFTGVVVNSLFIDIFEASKLAIIFWLISGLFVSLVRNRLYGKNI